jgi:hypothetical protein
MRQLVSYDDIASRQEQPQTQLTDNDSVRPAKKRRNNKKSKAKAPPRHWDEPSIEADAGQVNDEAEAGQEHEPGRYDGGSRELTYDEVWDDSALIDAWNAATEEYEVRSAFCPTHQLLNVELESLRPIMARGRSGRQSPSTNLLCAFFLFVSSCTAHGHH